MPYSFYCTKCGKRLSQNNEEGTRPVLFDLGPLVAGEEGFKVLQWFVDSRELHSLVDGTRTVQKGNGDFDYHEVTISFEKCVRNIAARKGLSSDGMTIDTMKAYLDEGLQVDDDESKEEEASKQDVQSIFRTLIQQGDDALWDVHAEDGLKNDLRMLRDKFKDGNLTAYIELYHAKDDKDEDVLEGFDYYYGGQRKFARYRVCSCGSKLFQHAGEAEHRTITFVGQQSSGKTSTIVALADYAERGSFDSKSKTGIWKEAPSLNALCSISLCEDGEVNARLRNDLSRYHDEGCAPLKTNDPSNSYSATFLIKPNTNEAGQNLHNCLLTLYDIPGELCGEKKKDKPDTEKIAERQRKSYDEAVSDKLDIERIWNEYPITLNCDAFIVCFDTEMSQYRSEDDSGASIWPQVQKICSWADEYQRLRQREKHVQNYAPMMLLFTKCKEVEQNRDRKGNGDSELDSDYSNGCYLFREELDRMMTLEDKGKRELYKYTLEEMQKNDFKKAFISVLRCSPFGFDAPLEKKPEETKRLPEPYNVDKLLYWLLMVSRCAPVEAEFRANDLSGSTERDWALNSYYLTRPQYRDEKPLNDSDQEALARCSLFANPGYFDRELVETHRNKWDHRYTMFRWRQSKFSNHLKE